MHVLDRSSPAQEDFKEVCRAWLQERYPGAEKQELEAFLKTFCATSRSKWKEVKNDRKRYINEKISVEQFFQNPIDLSPKPRRQTVCIQNRVPGDDKNRIDYLSEDSVLSHPNVQLVSSDGAYFKLNAALLASASKTMASILNEERFDTEPFYTVITEVSRGHLASFCNFVATGRIPKRYFEDGTKQSFQHLGIHLEELNFTVDSKSSDPDLEFEGRLKPFESSPQVNVVKTEVSSEIQMRESQVSVKLETEEEMTFEDDYDVKYEEEEYPLVSPKQRKCKPLSLFDMEPLQSDLEASPGQKRKILESPLESEEDSKPPIKKYTSQEKKKGSNLVNTYECDLCQKTFMKKQNLRAHIFSSHPGAYPEQYTVRKEQRVHRRTKMKNIQEGSHKCERCPFSTDSAGDLKTHGLRHIAQDLANQHPSFSCRLCKIELTEQNKTVSVKIKALEEHLSETHPDETYIFCPRCGNNFESKEDLSEHEKLHFVHSETLEKTAFIEDGKVYDGYFCRKCKREGVDINFKLRKDLVSHVREQHISRSKVLSQENGQTAWACNKCKENGLDMVFQTKSDWMSHCKEEHNANTDTHKGWKLSKPRKKPPICPQCGKMALNLEKHNAKYHSGEHKCDQCEKAFEDGKRLMEHVNLHHNFVSCDVCGDQVAKYLLWKHKRNLHSKTEDWKKHTCDQCSPPKKFNDKHAFRDHMNIHLGLKPHVCQRGCSNVAYANRSTLAAHYRSFHEGKKRQK